MARIIPGAVDCRRLEHLHPCADVLLKLFQLIDLRLLTDFDRSAFLPEPAAAWLISSSRRLLRVAALGDFVFVFLKLTVQFCDRRC